MRRSRVSSARRGPPRRTPQRLGVAHSGVALWRLQLAVLMLLFLAMRFADQLPPPAAALVGPGPPFARHGSAIDAHAPVLVLDDRGLRLDGRPVTSEADVGRNELDLDGALRSLARSWSILHPRERYPGRVLLDVPRRTPWRLVRTVTLAAARAAHPHIAFVVESPPREPALDWSHLVGR